MANAPRDNNRIATLLGVSSVDLETPTRVAVNPSTGAVLIDGTSLYATLDSRYVNVTGDTMTGQLMIDGGSNQIQLLVQGNATQTASLATFENSSGADQVTISNTGAVVINEQGNDADLRVEGDTDANLLFTDASTDRVGIGTATPTAGKLEVVVPASGSGISITGTFTDGTIRNSGLFSSAMPLTFTPNSQPSLLQAGIDAVMVFSGTVGAAGGVRAMNYDLRLQGTGTFTNLGDYNPAVLGTKILVRTLNPFAGTISGEMVGGWFGVSHTAGAGTVSKIAGIEIAAPGYTAGGTVSGSVYGGRIANQGNAAWTTSYGLYVDPQSGSTNSYSAIFEGGNVGVGVTAPTAVLHLKAGTATANTAPLKLNSGTKLTTAEAGVHEYNGNHLLTNAAVRFPVGGTLFDFFADVTVGGAEADIFSATLAANTFNGNGDKVVASYGGNFVTGGTELTDLLVKFAGTTIWDSTGLAPATGTTSWRVNAELIRVSSTVIRYTVSLNTTGASGYVYCTVGELTGLTLSGTNILLLRGSSSGVGSGSGDIVGKMGSIDFRPAA